MVRCTVAVLIAAQILLVISARCVQSAASARPNNPYGAHLFITDAMSPENIEKHTTWARSLVGERGYCKLFLYPITHEGAPEIQGRLASWKLAVQACYDKQMIPILRLGGEMKDGVWQKPADFEKTAQAIKSVISQLPKSDDYPMIVEVFNEPNLHIEWSGKTEPVEYARFFVLASKALRSLNDPRIIIANGALSPGGDFNNVEFIKEVCAKVPEFAQAFDVWATHCYPGYPPEMNMHDGTMPPGSYTLDLYLDELKALEKFGRKDVKVIITETAYSLGADGEDARADKMMRAFRDFWSKWPEVLAVTPYEFCCPWPGNEGVDWVYADSGVTPDGLPTKAHEQYWAVYKLAKPTDSTGAISGKVTESDFGAPLAEVSVSLEPGGLKTTTDAAGNYFFPHLSPGKYSVTAGKEHYKTATNPTITVTAGSNSVADFSLETTSKVTVRGTVRDSLNGMPVQGVTDITEPGGFKATTNENGQYLFVGIPPSNYSLRAHKDGYYPYSVSGVVVKPNETKEIDWYTAPGANPKGKHLIGAGDLEGTQDQSIATEWTCTAGQAPPGIFQVDKSVCYIGTSSQKITPNGSDANSIWSISNYNVPVTGKRYRIRVWCKTENAEGKVRAIGRFVSNAMEASGEFEVGPVLSGTNGWTLLSGSGVAPEFGNLKENSGRLQVLLEADLDKGSAWFDNIWVGEDEGKPLPAAPVDFRAEPGKFSALLSWKLVEGAKAVRIVCKPGSYPTSIDDGKELTVPEGATSLSQPDLHPSSRWYFAAFAVGEDGTLSEPTFASAQPVL